MADILIPVALESLINLLTHEASLLHEVKDQVSLLQGDLRIMNAFLKDSAGKHNEHHLVKELFDQISDVALEAENVVDTYIAKIIKHRRRNQLGKLFGIFGHSNMLHDVARKTARIEKKIRNIYKHKAIYGIREAECSRSVDLEANQSLQRRRRKVEEDDVIGFSIHTAKLCFTSISDDLYEMSDEQLEVTLHNYLKGKRYLVVMDDVWKTQVWEDVRSAFPNDLNGSRILITSREKEVASHASLTPPYFVPFLDNDASWELLCKKVFRGEKCPSNLETVGRKLAESCKGLPLSIVVLGGILSSSTKPRRLSVHCNPSNYAVASNACDTSSVRSLMFFCQGNNFEKKHWQWIWEGFKFIRVLTLLDIDNISSIPNKIEKLIYLKYLKIGNDKRTEGLRSIDTIPDSICKLRYLETIDLGIQVKDHSWPRGMWRMKQARYMQAYGPMKLPDLQPQSCENDNILCNLQVISDINVDRKTALIISKSKFPNLKELSLCYSAYEEHMDGLEITEVLVSLENLCYLQKLEINGFPKCQPHFKYLASTLTKVSFYGSYVDSFLVRILGKLPNLLFLKIERAQNVPKLSFVAGEFPQLQVFKMINYGVEIWEVERNAMPNLQHLVIIRDFTMKALPDELWCLESLQDVKVQAVSHCLWEFLLGLKCIMSVRIFEGPTGKLKELTMKNGAKLLMQHEHDEWYMK
ncbi:hypothetical protein FEM48_Zijuj05G0163700 [Ziziphus jujuba var. spinosa]|uniref:Uncharacterized protein n=1 Tax=Ziziphus jujuba var. spinosa TaxID=714518 RepID=A0A978VFV2_ZIZJJ|nr:hypothetical protein FEM48_Zijuj05G0163700 [Ziziphus jujuba var. spinosa]